ncbi:MAG: GxxExxY protein [Armatimonadetes bacterium]|nr:GxxExxY protein [Armatimonadota bacterium]
MPAHVERAASTVVDAAIAVHRALGPGLLESLYERCLAYELSKRGLEVRTQVALPVVYDGVTFDDGLRLDILVEDCLVVEVKAVEALQPIHEAQLLTYLKLLAMPLGFLLNFNVTRMKLGIRRFRR